MSGRLLLASLCLSLLACTDESGEDPAPTSVSPSTAPTPEEQPALVADELYRIDGHAFEGSPAICDLEGDGSPEAILLIGEDARRPPRVVAIDVETGDTEWTASDATYNLYAYPLCHDLDGDGVLDILTGGRNSDVIALSGVDGSEVWTLTARNPGGVPGLPGFTGSSVRTGEYFMVTASGDRTTDAAGAIVVFDASGAIVASWQEPSGGEIYSSLAAHPAGAGRWHLAVGSGGETEGGFLRIIEWDERALSFSELASAPSACAGGGFVSSSVMVDADRDDRLDALGTDFCGTTTMLGGNGEVLWTADQEFPYGTANPALSDLNGDGTPEAIVTFTNRSVEAPAPPEETGSSIAAFGIRDGRQLWERSIDEVSIASPVTFDATGDGTLDVGLLTARGAPFLVEGDPDLADEAGFRVLAGEDGEEIGHIDVGDAGVTPLLHPSGEDTLLLIADTRPLDDSAVIAMRMTGVQLDRAAAWSGFRPGDDHGATWTSP